MKNLVIAFIALVTISACQPKNGKIELNLTKGETYHQKMVADMDISQTINGQKIDMKMGMTGKMSYKVTDVVDTVYQFQVQYTGLSMKMTMPTGTVEFNSDKAANANDMMSQFLGAMKNNPFDIKMSKSGKIIEVKNIENIYKGLDAFTQLTEQQKAQVKAQLSQSFGEKSMKGNLEMSTAIFPTKEVKKGDTWTIKTKMENSVNANIETTYTLKDVTDEFYIISGAAKITPSAKTNSTNAVGVDYDMNGTMTSELKLSRKTGWMVHAAIQQAITGSSEVKNAMGITKIPINLNSRITITNE